MKSYTERLYQALEYELDENYLSQSSESQSLKAAIELCKKAMSKLRNYIASYFFNSIEDEVYFFKQIKPLFYSKFIYYICIYNFQLNKPIGSAETIKDYIDSELTDLRRFFDHNQAFYQYSRSGATQMDHLFFTRGGVDMYAEADDFQRDEMFSTGYDYTLSKIIAIEKFHEYLSHQIKRISNDSDPTIERPVVWTGNQTDLVELTYALAESGVLNNGNIEIKVLMDYFQDIFQVDLKHYYHKYANITNRKKERTAFLEKLKSNLVKRIDNKYELKEPTLRRIDFHP